MKERYYISFLFPFEKVEKGRSIIIYGAGSVGRAIAEQIISTRYGKILFFVDKRFDTIKSVLGIKVCSSEAIKVEENCVIVVAVNGANDGLSVCKELIEKGVMEDNIIYPVHYSINKYYDSKVRCIECLPYDSRFESYYENMLHELKIMKAKDEELTRVGNKNDGGYVMLELNDSIPDKIAYSFGINNDYSWDIDMSDRGYDVYMYDYSIKNIINGNEKLHFFSKGISNRAENKEEGCFDSLSDFIRDNGHQNNRGMILKMDVEGAEWDVLDSLQRNVLNMFDQILVEYHGIINEDEKKLRVLKKINETHQVVHVHGNNNCNMADLKDGEHVLPDVLEVSYALRKVRTFESCDNLILPIDLDHPNAVGIDEIILGKWNLYGK